MPNSLMQVGIFPLCDHSATRAPDAVAGARKRAAGGFPVAHGDAMIRTAFDATGPGDRNMEKIMYPLWKLAADDQQDVPRPPARAGRGRRCARPVPGTCASNVVDADVGAGRAAAQSKAAGQPFDAMLSLWVDTAVWRERYEAVIPRPGVALPRLPGVRIAPIRARRAHADATARGSRAVPGRVPESRRGLDRLRAVAHGVAGQPHAGRDRHPVDLRLPPERDRARAHLRRAALQRDHRGEFPGRRDDLASMPSTTRWATTPGTRPT